jgi:hypothetical protein
MAETNSTVLEMKATNTQVLDHATLTSGSKATVTHDALNLTTTLNNGSDAPLTDVISGRLTLSGAGSGEIDLTSGNGTNGATVTGTTGKKVQYILIRNNVGTPAVLTMTSNVTDGYDLFGTDFTLEIDAGASLLYFADDAAPDIAASADKLSFSGGNDKEFDYQIGIG